MSRKPATRCGYVPVSVHFCAGTPNGRLRRVGELIGNQMLILDLDYEESFFANSSNCFTLAAKAHRYVLNGWSIRRAFVKEGMLDVVNKSLGVHGVIVAKVLT